jgi:hypothetical protein
MTMLEWMDAYAVILLQSRTLVDSVNFESTRSVEPSF